MSGLPLSFRERIKTQIDDYDNFFKCLETGQKSFVRVHPQKSKFAKNLPAGSKVVWNSDGIELEERPVFHKLPEYHSGIFYPMESSSMFLEFVLSQLDVKEDALLLDLCAAPGGKTLILKDHYPFNLLVSNETDHKRAHILRENSIRWGTDEHIVLHSDARKIAESQLKFDLILVDAPCSGEGLFRKDIGSRNEWTEEKAQGCAIRQQQILDDIYPALSPGGTIIYSTCTFNPAENIDQVARFGVENKFIPITLNVPPDWNISEIQKEGFTGYQFWPHRVSGEGFFLAVLKDHRNREKSLEGAPRIRESAFDHLQDVDLSEFWIQEFGARYYALTSSEIKYSSILQKHGTILKKGLYLGEIKGKEFIPSYDLAMHPKGYEFTPRLNLTHNHAMAYLQGQSLQISTAPGPVLLTFENLNLGFGKSNRSRINNLYPKHLRLSPTSR